MTDPGLPHRGLALLARAFRERADGVLSLGRGSTTIALVLHEGHIVGVVFPEDGRSPGAAAGPDDSAQARLDRLLSEIGIRPPAPRPVPRTRRSLRERMLSGLLDVETTGAAFADGAPPPSGVVDVAGATEALILEAIRRVPDPQAVRDGLGDLDQRLVPSAAIAEERTLTLTEGYILSHVDGSATARDVLRRVPLEPRETERTMLGLLLTGRLEYRPAVAKTVAAARAEAPAPAAADSHEPILLKWDDGEAAAPPAGSVETTGAAAVTAEVAGTRAVEAPAAPDEAVASEEPRTLDADSAPIAPEGEPRVAAEGAVESLTAESLPAESPLVESPLVESPLVESPDAASVEEGAAAGPPTVARFAAPLAADAAEAEPATHDDDRSAEPDDVAPAATIAPAPEPPTADEAPAEADDAAPEEVAAPSATAARAEPSEPEETPEPEPEAAEADHEAPVAPIEPEAAERRREVLAFFESLSTKNHFEVLGVEPGCKDADVKRAYAALARKYHPDLHHRGGLEDLHDVLEAIFIRVGEAWEVLGDARSRRSYEARLAPGRPATADGTTPGEEPEPYVPGEETVHAAQLLLSQARYWDAIQMLEARLPQMPPSRQQRRGRILLARAYAKNPNWLRRAEEALQQVVREDPGNADAHYELGLLYKAGGMLARAQGSFRRALDLQPDHRSAAAELGATPASAPPSGGGLLKRLFGSRGKAS